MLDEFQGVGLTFREASISLRERVAYNETSAKLFLRKLKDILGLEEALLISTCNRTEIYFSSEEKRATEVLKLLAIDRDLNSPEVINSFRVYEEPVKQLFRVALGLDAQVLGDLQIINQVKTAYQWSADEQMAGPGLHRLMHTIFFANKRVVQETAFRDGTASMASVAVGLIEKITDQVADPKILIVGLGEIGLNILENLSDAYSDVTLMNRTGAKAEKFARLHGHRAAPYMALSDEVNRADVILCAARVEAPIIWSAHVHDSLTTKLMIDLSVPRSVDQKVEDKNGVLLYTTDDLREMSEETLRRRESAIPEVTAIMEECLKDFGQWAAETEVSPTIQLLKQRLEEIRKEEIDRALKNVTPEASALLEDVTKRMIQKVIKLPVLQLKAACKRGEAENLVDVLHNLFNLEEDSKKQAAENRK